MWITQTNSEGETTVYESELISPLHFMHMKAQFVQLQSSHVRTLVGSNWSCVHKLNDTQHEIKRAWTQCEENAWRRKQYLASPFKKTPFRALERLADVKDTLRFWILHISDKTVQISSLPLKPCFFFLSCVQKLKSVGHSCFSSQAKSKMVLT